MEKEPTVSIELEWAKPSQTFGELTGYKLRYGVKDQPLKEEIIKSSTKTSRSFVDLGKTRTLPINGVYICYFIYYQSIDGKTNLFVQTVSFPLPKFATFK